MLCLIKEPIHPRARYNMHTKTNETGQRFVRLVTSISNMHSERHGREWNRDTYPENESPRERLPACFDALLAVHHRTATHHRLKTGRDSGDDARAKA